MLKKFYSWLMMGALLLPTACSYDDSDIWNSVNDLDKRVENLEEIVKQLNTDVTTLSQLMTGKQFIENVEDQGNGVRIVHLISANGEKSTIEIRDGKDGVDGKDGQDGKDGADGKDGQNGKDGADGKDGQNGKDGADGKDGKDGVTPVVSVRQDSDGNYYWTVNGEWLIIDGQKVRANGIDGLDGKDGADGKDGQNGKDGADGKDGQDGKDGTDGKDGQDGKDGVDGKNGIAPAFRIENGRWMVSLDRGITWHDCGQATGSDGDSFFKDAQTSADGKYAYLTLADGTVLTFEIYRQFGIAFDIAKVLVQEGTTKDISFTVTGMTPETQVEAIGKKGWDADVKLNADGSGTLTVSAPATPGTGAVIVLLNNGSDKTVMRTLTFVSGIVNVSDSSIEVDQEGGTKTISVETNLEFVISVPDDVNWVKVTGSRALRTEKFQIEVNPSDDPSPRTALLSVETPDGKPLESILVVQSPITFDPARLVFRVDPSKTPDTGVSTPFSSLSVKGGTIYIDWGDGSDVQECKASSATSTSLATADRYPKHVYADKTRSYNVQVWGDFVQLSGSNVNYCKGITKVVQWGSAIKYTAITLACETLESVPAPVGNQFANLSTLSFENCTALKSVSPKLLSGTTNKLYSFNRLFKKCTSLEEIPEGFFDPVVKISGFQDMFYGCTSLKAIRSGFTNATDFGTSFSISSVDVFRDCSSLETMPDKFFPEGLFKKVTSVKGYFWNCASLRSLHPDFFKGLGEGLNSSSKIVAVTNLVSMFDGCESLESLNMDFLNTHGVLQAYSFSATFRNCGKLKATVPSYKWEYNGNTYDVALWDRVNYIKSTDADMAAAAKLVFGTRTSYSSANCFTGAEQLTDYAQIPSAWGGPNDGILNPPTLTVNATPTPDAEYYSVDFNIKATEVQQAFYYLSTPKGIENVLPQYNNSLEEMVLTSGTEIKNEYNAPYLDQLATDHGLTLYFEGGMPDNDYAIAVVVVNSKGKATAYAETTTAPMPKGCDEYEAYAGTWTVTSESTLIDKLDADENIVDIGPSTFEVTIVPNRVDESYIFYGWGLSIFRDHPMMAKFNKQTKALELWNGVEGAVNIMNGYKFDKTDDPNAIFSSYNVLYYPYLENPTTHYIDYWSSGASCECILAGTHIPAVDRVTLSGQRSAYNSSAEVGDVYWMGMEVVLAMGSMSTSQTWTPMGIILPEEIVTYEGEKFVPHHMAPYTMTRKSAEASVPAKAPAKVPALKPAAAEKPVSYKASFR